MKIDEVISKMEKIEEKYGNLPVCNDSWKMEFQDICVEWVRDWDTNEKMKAVIIY